MHGIFNRYLSRELNNPQ